MAAPRSRRRPGLRVVLLLALLPLAALPWLGMRFVETVAGLARDVQLDNLQVAARGLAASLDDRIDLFDPGDGIRLPAGVESVAVTAVGKPPEALATGGWGDEGQWQWHTLPVDRIDDAPADTLQVEAAVLREGRGRSAQRWVVVRARDERLVPPGDLDLEPIPGAPVIAAGDSLTVTVGDAGDWSRLLDADRTGRPEGPIDGRIERQPEGRIEGRSEGRSEGRIERPEGRGQRRYPVTLEASARGGWRAQQALPDDGRLIRLQVDDVDYLGTRRIEARADSGWWLLADRDDPEAPMAMAAVAESRRANLMRAFERSSGTVRVHAADGRILAERGTPPRELPPPQGWSAWLARLVIGFTGATHRAADRDQPPVIVSGDPREPPPGRRDEIDATASALAGALAGVATRASVPIAAAGGLPVWLLTAAQPIWVDGRVAGALVLEDTTLARAAPGLATIESLSGLVLAAFAASVLAVLGVATLTVRRIARLHRAAENAIDARGRVVGTVPASRWHDEIGLLAASHARVLDRLREHQTYLTRLRSRLVHELRTPVMVVRSSLENLTLETEHVRNDSAAVARYGQRALDGAARLEQILAAMSAASSLESLLEARDLEAVDLIAIGRGCIEGYAMAYPGHRWRLQASVAAAPCIAIGDAVAQALDKLAANAADFATPGSEVVLEIGPLTDSGGDAAWRLVMDNDGPALPPGRGGDLFESLVSVRADGDSRTGSSHLGLGLHLVQLIANFHGGTVVANDRRGGVRIGFSLPAT